MNTLFAGFEGKYNSSKVFLDKLKVKNKLYLKNDKQLSCKQLEKALTTSSYDYVYLFGQKPRIKNKFCFEKSAKMGGKVLETDVNIEDLVEKCAENGILSYVSSSAGTSYCNHLYYFTLFYLKNHNLKTKILFIHLPYLKNFSQLEELVEKFNGLCKTK